MNLTPRQSDALSFIASFHAEKGFGPSYREIGEAMGLASIGGVHRLVTGLEERGAIRRLPERARSIEVVRQLGPVAEGHLKAILADVGRYGHVHLESLCVVEAMRYLARRQQ